VVEIRLAQAEQKRAVECVGDLHLRLKALGSDHRPVRNIPVRWTPFGHLLNTSGSRRAGNVPTGLHQSPSDPARLIRRVLYKRPRVLSVSTGFGDRVKVLGIKALDAPLH
jgi:hypothetical protein